MYNLKVGDKVRLMGPGWPRTQNPLRGSVQTVSKCEPVGDLELVGFEGDVGTWFVGGNYSLELVEESMEFTADEIFAATLVFSREMHGNGTTVDDLAYYEPAIKNALYEIQRIRRLQNNE